MGEVAVFLVSHLNASAVPFPFGCARDNLSVLDLTEFHHHAVLGIALVGNQVDASPPRFRCRIMEIGGVASGEGDENLIRAQGIKRAVVDGDAVIAFRNHTSSTLDGEARRAHFVWLDDDIAHEPNRVGVPKHIALVFARNLDGLCQKRGCQQSHPNDKKQTFFHGIKRLSCYSFVSYQQNYNKNPLKNQPQRPSTDFCF